MEDHEIISDLEEASTIEKEWEAVYQRRKIVEARLKEQIVNLLSNCLLEEGILDATDIQEGIGFLDLAADMVIARWRNKP